VQAGFEEFHAADTDMFCPRSKTQQPGLGFQYQLGVIYARLADGFNDWASIARV